MVRAGPVGLPVSCVNRSEKDRCTGRRRPAPPEQVPGAVVLVPMETALAKYCTLAMEPTVVAGLLVSVVATLIGSVALAAGAVIAIVGAVEPLTVTLIALLVVWLPAASVATAVSE